MLSKIKKIFFVGMFGILYISFAAQLVYVIMMLRDNADSAFIALGLLSLEWLALIGARYLSKKSSSGGREGYYNGGSNYRR
ncbi:MAG: hypothetical protein FWC61_00285 [Proteobacteria bacterium]|nr:hypothetical protein [Pseudomonadota bacterium]